MCKIYFIILIFSFAFANSVGAGPVLDHLRSEQGFRLNLSDSKCKINREDGFENVAQILASMNNLIGAKSNLAIIT
jgi:hypothetical protein